MTFRRAIGSPTKAQKAYQDRVRNEVNACVMCLLLGCPEQCGAVRLHHRTLDDKHGQLQLGQDKVVLLGDWHHQGVLMEAYPTVDLMLARFGPSFHHHKRAFLQAVADKLYASGTEALQDLQDAMLNGVPH